MKRLAVCIAAVLVAVCLLAVPAGAAGTPKGCRDALKAAETLQVHLLLENSNREDAMNETTTALTTTGVSYANALNGVTAAVRKLTSELRALAPIYIELNAEYRAAAKRCRAGR